MNQSSNNISSRAIQLNQDVWEIAKKGSTPRPDNSEETRDLSKKLSPSVLEQQAVPCPAPETPGSSLQQPRISNLRDQDVHVHLPSPCHLSSIPRPTIHWGHRSSSSKIERSISRTARINFQSRTRHRLPPIASRHSMPPAPTRPITTQTIGLPAWLTMVWIN
jgi:hypothetical protein